MTTRTTRAQRILPIVAWLSRYEKTWWRPDLLAGLTVWALLVPEAMAYAELAGMPPETGLYAGLGAIVAYAVFGTSRQMFVGPSSTVAILSASTVAAVATASEDFVAMTVALALLVGVVFIAFGLFRLGFISVFMSRSVLVGFTFGLGLTIAVDQAAEVVGVTGGSGNFFEKLWSLLESLPDIDTTTTIIGLVSFAILLVSRMTLGRRAPAALVVVIAAVALSTLLDWSSDGVEVVGDVPAALPRLTLPDVSLRDLIMLVPGAIGIVVVAFAEGYGIAANYARSHGHDIDANQEMVATGAANIGAGLLGGFTVSGSLSKSAAADDAGARTQMAMLICGVVTLLTIAAFTPVFENLPSAVLGAVVIAAVWGTFNVVEMRRIWRIRRGDFAAAMAALVGVCAVGILEGLAIAVGISFVMLVYLASRPRMPTLGHLPGRRAYASTDTAPLAIKPERIAVVRLDAPLFFANAEAFQERMAEIIAREPDGIVVNLETVNYVDVDGADALRSVVETAAARGMAFGVARLNAQGREILRKAGVYDLIGERWFFASVDSAVRGLKEAPRPGFASGP